LGGSFLALEDRENMTKRRFAFVGSLMALVMVLSAFTYLLYMIVQYHAFLVRRHHLLCEVMQPSMSRDEVLKILQEAGDFTVSEYASTDRFFALDVHFTDPQGLKGYGYFSLVFIDNGYARAVVPRGSDNPEYICDFYQTTTPAALTPP
jgi:hypothetical protein